MIVSNKILLVVLCTLAVASSASGNNNNEILQEENDILLHDDKDYQSPQHPHNDNKQLRGGLRQLKKNNAKGISGVNTNAYPATAYHPAYASESGGGGGGVRGDKKKKNSWKGGGKNGGNSNFQVTDRFDNPGTGTTVHWTPETVDTYQGYTPMGNTKNHFKSGGGGNWKSGGGGGNSRPAAHNTYQGGMETKPCIPFQSLSHKQLSNPYSARDCLTSQYNRGGGCCRSYWWLILDEKGTSFPSVPCVCNPWTRDPATFNYQPGGGTIDVMAHNAPDGDAPGGVIFSFPGDEGNDPGFVDVPVDRTDEAGPGDNAIVPGLPIEPKDLESVTAHIPGLAKIPPQGNLCKNADPFMGCSNTGDCYKKQAIIEAKTNICCHKRDCACNFFENAANDCMPLE